MRWTVHLEGGPRRVNHAAVSIGEKIYSFGGYCTGEDYREPRPMDVHILDTVTLRWTALPQLDPADPQRSCAPFQRYGHTAVAYGELVFIWGGRNDLTACNALYSFNTATRQWAKPATRGDIPGARDGHSACIINHCMYIFGGYEEDIDQFSQDVHALSLRTMTWHFVKTQGTPPRRRDFHSATAIGSFMYIFGGRGGRIGPHYATNEIYCNRIMYLDTVTRTWSEPHTFGILPIGRRSHSAFLYNDKLYVFGGFSGLHNLHFGDLFRYDPTVCHWSIVKVNGRGPCARRRQCCCVSGDKAFLFGGTSPYPSDIAPPVIPAPPNGLDPNLMDHNDLHVLDFAPTLKTLCKIAVIESKLDVSCLPLDIKWEIAVMTTNNVISRSINNAG